MLRGAARVAENKQQTKNGVVGTSTKTSPRMTDPRRGGQPEKTGKTYRHMPSSGFVVFGCNRNVLVAKPVKIDERGEREMEIER